MNKRDYLIVLYDYYCELFNEKQRTYFEDYYFNNLSLGEISENLDISRNAVHKVLKNIEEKLLFYEDKIELYKKTEKIKKLINETKDEKIKEKLKELI